MSQTKPVTTPENRRDTRAPLLATALVSREGEPLGRFNVVNLSAGGALLSGHLALPVGTKLEVTLRMPWRPSIRTLAELTRVDGSPGHGTFALAFPALSAADGDVIHSAVVHLLRKARSARVLVVTEQEMEVCHSFVVAIEDLGCSAIAVATVSEAVRLLEAAHAIRVVIFDERLRRNGNPDLLAQLAREQPKIRRVLLSDSRHHGNPCRQIGVQAVLEKPCTAAALAAALAIAPSLRERSQRSE
jgi:CheY-like chemotaxis protein